ncbi:MAG: ubiquinol-cytochrome c reductase iron-sulfur subunit [Leptolyngbyaceae cyanobacterium MO_188.B28]|nr:ubiquinol-cytochrome c reductase iron-sulfur subunit [Leptolyngbyaceae cyanobacterium MO_188.B28]
MKRRAFLTWVGVGGLASSLPIALAACSPDTSSETASQFPETQAELAAPTEAAAPPPREDGFTAVGTVAELDEQGSLTNKTLDVAVIRDPANATAVIAVNSRCTHQGCSVNWDEDATLFYCPCHGSRFNSDGSVANGPAVDPLGEIEAKIEADSVLVKLS